MNELLNKIFETTGVLTFEQIVINIVMALVLGLIDIFILYVYSFWNYLF